MVFGGPLALTRPYGGSAGAPYVARPYGGSVGARYFVDFIFVNPPTAGGGVAGRRRQSARGSTVSLPYVISFVFFFGVIFLVPKICFSK